MQWGFALAGVRAPSFVVPYDRDLLRTAQEKSLGDDSIDEFANLVEERNGKMRMLTVCAYLFSGFLSASFASFFLLLSSALPVSPVLFVPLCSLTFSFILARVIYLLFKSVLGVILLLSDLDDEKGVGGQAEDEHGMMTLGRQASIKLFFVKSAELILYAAGMAFISSHYDVSSSIYDIVGVVSYNADISTVWIAERQFPNLDDPQFAREVMLVKVGTFSLGAVIAPILAYLSVNIFKSSIRR